MANLTRYIPRTTAENQGAVPFDTPEQAWFLFVQAQTAREEGAQLREGEALVQRPCEPLDIFHALDRLYRNRCLLRDHLLVLRHYGLRLKTPNKNRPKEARAASLWREAMSRLEPILVRKGIVSPAAPNLQPVH